MSDTRYCEKTSECFPRMLKDIPKSPIGLYYRGNIDVINEMDCVAIIGMRNPSPNGMDISYAFGKACAENGFVTVNGLAIGCDTAALRGALDAGGKCGAILPCGLDRIYPKNNQGLADEIIEKGGVLLSEYPDGTGMQKYFFVERDRLQSGISKGIIIIEAKEDGGTMHTVYAATKQNRRLACYYDDIARRLSGNTKIANMPGTTTLPDGSELRCFLDKLKNDPLYEQLSFSFEM